MKKYYPYAMISLSPTGNQFIPSRIYTILLSQGVEYGFDDIPYNYVHAQGTQNTIYYAQLTNATNTATQITINRGGQAVNYKSAVPMMYAVDSDSPWHNQLVSDGVIEIPSEGLTGSYRIDNTLYTPYTTTVNYNLRGASGSNAPLPIICNFSIDGTLYRGFTFFGSTNYSNPPTFTANKIRLHLYGGGYADYTPSEFANVFNESIIAFIGDIIPTSIADWFRAITKRIYTNTFTIKKSDGEIIGELTNIAPIKEITVNTLNNLVVVGVTDINNESYEIEWVTTPPPEKAFTGLSYESDSTTVDIGIGQNLVDIQNSVVLYEVFDYYNEITQPFDIYLYQNTAEPNRVDKTDYLTDVLQLHGVLRDECSLLAPSIIFESSTYLQFNYVYIPAFGRYYFVVGIDSVSKNLWRMRLNCDVLMTYRTEIQQLNAVIDRQEYYYNALLNDANMPAQVNKIVDVIEVPSSDILGGGTFNTQEVQDIKSCNFILLTVGEGATQ